MVRQRRRAAVGALVVVLASAGASVVPTTRAGADPRGVVRVAGGPERLPSGTRALGAWPGTRALTVDVALAPSDPSGLQAFADAVTTPGSPSFRDFLAPGQFAARFGPSAGAVAATRAWLRAAGLDVGATAGDGLLIPVSGTASQMTGVFGVGLVQEQLPSGRIVREPTGRPAVPAGLAGVVQGVVGLDDLARPTAQWSRPGPGPTTTPPTVSLSSGPVAHAGPSACAAAQEAGTTGTELADAYSLSSLYGTDEGQGVTIGLYELEPFLPSDIGAFESCYAIAPVVNGVSVDGADPTSGPGSGEAALDIEMVAGLAPRATIDAYVGNNFGVGPLDVFSAMVNDDQAQVLSTSWGECEADAGTAELEVEATLFEQAAAQGQSFVAAAGDEGSEDCNAPGITDDTSLDVDDPASQPWVTGVGGTDLTSPGPPPVESVWNTGAFEGTGGGGLSTTWTMPSWQLGPGVDNAYTDARDPYTGASACPLSAGPGTVSCREVPDVSADGDPATGFATFCSCGSGSWQLIGGTSMGAPLWASVAALADESVASPPGRIGLLNPALYQAGCLGTRPFNDVTAGDNQPLGTSPSDPPRQPGPYYPATSGYDLASGLGTPVASALVPDLVHPVDACPQVTSVSVDSGPAGGGTVVTLTGANLAGVQAVDFGAGNPGVSPAVSATQITVTTPPSPTGGWDTALVEVTTADDTLGLDGRYYFTYTGPRGYWTAASDGGIFTFGHQGYYRSLGGVHLDQPVVGMAPTASSKGYWLVASDGGVFAFGDAGFHGSLGDVHLDKPVVGMAATPDGGGYWLVASDGGVFAFGDAGFHGSLGDVHLDKPVVGMAATPDGGGYWLVASDGGVFAFGDAGFHGSLGGMRLSAPVVGMAATPDGAGYWLVASDGGVFSLGDATFYGSMGGTRLARPVVGVATPFGGGGYWLVASDGGVFAFGDAAYGGSMGGRPLDAPMVGIGGS